MEPKRQTATSRVYIIDDHPVVRRGLQQLLERESDLSVCGEAENVSQALLSIPDLAPDLILSDLMLDGLDGLELTRRLAISHPHLPVLIISMHQELFYARRALNAGARGYVMKRHAEEEVIRAVHEVLSGRLYVSEQVLRQLQANIPLGIQAPAATLEALTNRELEVFLLMGQGFAPRHIAERLSLSTSTVEAYRERLKKKLKIENSSTLLRYAVRWCKDNVLP